MYVVCRGEGTIHNSILNARVRSINVRVRFLCIFAYLYLYKEYILLKLNTTSMPFGLNKGDDVISKILKYGNLFFEKLLTCVGTIMVSSEVIKHSNTDSMMRSLLIYAGLWVGISALFAVIKWSLNLWKKDWSRIVFVMAFQEPFAAIIGKMISISK